MDDGSRDSCGRASERFMFLKRLWFYVWIWRFLPLLVHFVRVWLPDREGYWVQFAAHYPREWREISGRATAAGVPPPRGCGWGYGEGVS